MTSSAIDAQYEHWRRQGGTAYAEQQRKYAIQWERQHGRRKWQGDGADTIYQPSDTHGLTGVRWSAEQDAREEARLILQEDFMSSQRFKDNAYEGLACVYGVVDSYKEMFLQGCFRDVRPGDVDYFMDHNQGNHGSVAKVLALWEVTRKELPLLVQLDHPEATGGLVVVRQYSGTVNAPIALQWVKSGQLNGLSVKFRPKKQSTGLDGITRIAQAELIEISDCRGQPAVPGVITVVGTKHYSFLQGQFRRKVRV